MTDDEKDARLAEIISTPYGKQWLAHKMSKSDKLFVYIPSKDGDEERTNAFSCRYAAQQETTHPTMAILLNRMADAWEEYAKLPKWKRKLYAFLEKMFGH